MPMPKEYRKLLEPLVEAGFRVERRRRSTHMVVIAPCGAVVTMIPSTPSDGRSFANTRADLKRFLRNHPEHATRVK